jgi:hypothetical protein
VGTSRPKFLNHWARYLKTTAKGKLRPSLIPSLLFNCNGPTQSKLRLILKKLTKAQLCNLIGVIGLLILLAMMLETRTCKRIATPSNQDIRILKNYVQWSKKLTQLF